MNKKIILMLLVLAVFISACQKESDEALYTNEELQFTLEMPTSWKGNFEAVSEKDDVFFYYGKGEEKTPIFSIKRYYGTSIENEDLLRIGENNQILDKVFDTTFVSSYKYKVKDSDIGELPPADMEAVYSKIPGILDSFETTMERAYRTDDKTSKEQFFGTLHCNMVMPNYYKLEKDEENIVTYNFLLGDKVVGVINMIPYGSGIPDEVKEGAFIAYKKNSELNREFRIAMLSEYIESYNFELMTETFRFLPGPTNIVDKMSQIIRNSSSKKEAVFGRILGVNMSGGDISLDFQRIFYDEREAVESEVEEGKYSYKLSSSCIVVPLAGPDYVGYDDYLYFDDAGEYFASQEYKGYKEQLYYLSFNAEGEVTGIVAEREKSATVNEETEDGN